MSDMELDIIKGRDRITIVCSIAHKRIMSTHELLGVPEDLVRQEYVVTKNQKNIELVSNCVNDINKMLNIELTTIGVIAATDQHVRDMVDQVRKDLAQLIDLIGDGIPESPRTEIIEEHEEEVESSKFPIALGVSAIVSIILAVVMIFIAIDSDD